MTNDRELRPSEDELGKDPATCPERVDGLALRGSTLVRWSGTQAEDLLDLFEPGQTVRSSFKLCKKPLGAGNSLEKTDMKIPRIVKFAAAVLMGTMAGYAQPVITKQPVDRSVSLGANARLQVSATSSALPLVYQWWF